MTNKKTGTKKVSGGDNLRYEEWKEQMKFQQLERLKDAVRKETDPEKKEKILNEMKEIYKNLN